MDRVVLPVLGEVRLSPLISKLARLPEVQRLRQVSLSNVDSCVLTGIGGVSRFEHSLGTAVLADHLARRLALGEQYKAELVLAAGLHDIGAPGLGHLFEEGCELAGVKYDHEQTISKIFLEERNVYYQPYLGKELGFRRLLNDYGVDASSVLAALKGLGRCGKAINGSMDLDNIDNVSRMLSRLGEVMAADAVLDLTQAYSLSAGAIVLDSQRQDLFEKWLRQRIRLYSLLMLEPADFAAKTMTKLAIATALRDGVLRIADWRLTDAELMRLLRSHSGTERIVERLLLGDYFRVVGMYWVEGQSSVEVLRRKDTRDALQQELTHVLNEEVHLDYIRDKRFRECSGGPSSRALVGVTSPTTGVKRAAERLCDQVVHAHLTVTEKVFPARARITSGPESLF